MIPLRRPPARLTLFQGRLVLVADRRPPTPWADRVALVVVWVVMAAVGALLAVWIGVGAP